MYSESSTIAAISTSMSEAGIGIVRMSGEDAFQIADRIYRGKNNKRLSDQSPTPSTTGILRRMVRRLTKFLSCL